MVKAKDGAERQAYTVRLRPDILKQIKHMSVDENRTVGELIEEGITLVLEKRNRTNLKGKE